MTKDKDIDTAEYKILTEDEDAKSKKLATQWPKRCGCGRVYDRRRNFRNTPTKATPTVWGELPFAYNYTDAFATQEARHCLCGSTIVVNVAIHDLSKE